MRKKKSLMSELDGRIIQYDEESDSITLVSLLDLLEQKHENNFCPCKECQYAYFRHSEIYRWRCIIIKREDGNNYIHNHGGSDLNDLFERCPFVSDNWNWHRVDDISNYIKYI